jgi:two-component system, sensor histidine kinase
MRAGRKASKFAAKNRVEARALVLAPVGSDAKLTSSILKETGIDCDIAPDLRSFCGKLLEGASVAILAEEALTYEGHELLASVLSRQPEWSDIPILFLTGRGADSMLAIWVLELGGNVTILERPIRIATLVSAVRSARKARSRQYELRDRLIALRESEERLQHAIAEIRENDRKKDEFLATLAHELRNPLAPITNVLALLERWPDRASREPSLQILKRQVNQMVRLIDDLLDISRITRGKLELRPESLDVNDVLQQAIETVWPHLEQAEQKLDVALNPGPLQVVGDRIRLAQVFANLLSNASKYTPVGGTVFLSSQDVDRQALVCVRDTGVGIPADKLDEIFEMFVQLDSKASNGLSGLGLGLTIVAKLVAMHGGEVEARSPGPGQGSEFRVRLPLAQTVPAEKIERWPSSVEML